MLPLPSHNPTSPIALADWLELVALVSPDHNSSRGDLETAVRRVSFAEVATDEEAETLNLDVFSEIERRTIGAADAYPFELASGSVLRPKSGTPTEFTAYLFCLLLSYKGLPDTKATPKLFERLAQSAAQEYLRGLSLGFGHPRIELPSPFDQAINELCSRMAEGRGFRAQPVLDRKDDALDVVAWAEFPDQQSSKVIIFGQCAAGRDWEAKAGELNPHQFVDQWFQAPPSHLPLRSLFIPHRVEPIKWDFISRKAGILFERCRIAFWAHRGSADTADHAAWVVGRLAGLS